MQTSPAGRAFLTLKEGKRLSAYQDSVGIWTIGVGHTAAAGTPAPVKGMTITDAECDAILARDLATFEAGVGAAVTVPLAQHQFDALVSFAFNVGLGALRGSTLLRKLNAVDYEGAAAQFGAWVKAGGKTLPGLVSRRADEAALFRTGVYAGVSSATAVVLPAIDADRVTTTGLNLRAAPVDGAVLTVLPDGTPLETVGLWRRVRAVVGGAVVEGYVSDGYTAPD